MNSVEFIDPAVVRGEDYTQYIEAPGSVPAKVATLITESVPQETEKLFEMPEPTRFANVSPPSEPPTENCFGYETIPLDIDRAIKVIDDTEVDEEKMFSLLYKLEHLNNLSREVAHLRDSILKS